MGPFLTTQEAQTLKKTHKKTKQRRHADRIKTILLLNEGYTYEQVARILLLDDSTIRSYETAYRQGGMTSLLTDQYSGKESLLTQKQEYFLRLHLRSITYQTVAEIVRYVEGRFGVFYSVRGMTKLLHRLRFTRKKLTIVPGKADAEKQAAFLADYRELQAKKKSEDVIYFGDGCHPQHNTIATYGWIEVGEKKQIRSNTGRKRINLHGVINSEDVTDIEVLNEETINADSVIRLLELLLVKHTGGMIYVIVDNARYYHAKKVTAFLTDHPRVRLVYLPAYAPNLNLIERLWLLFKRKILYNQYYGEFAQFERACMHFFSNFKRYKKEAESLLTDNFQIISTQYSEILVQ